MKVYKNPVPAPEWPQPFNDEQYEANNAAYEAATKQWGLDNGYTGKNTGRIAYFGVADGSAAYMVLEGKRTVLVHLEIGDAYSYPHVEYLPKAEVLKYATQAEKRAKLFAKQK